MTESKERCANCRFALKTTKSLWNCRRYPPVVHPLSMGDTVTDFPRISPEDWCGEWRLPKKLLGRLPGPFRYQLLVDPEKVQRFTSLHMRFLVDPLSISSEEETEYVALKKELGI